MLKLCLSVCLVTALAAQVSDKFADAGGKPDVVSVAPPNILQVDYSSSYDLLLL